MSGTLTRRRLVREETRDSVFHTYHDEEKEGLVEHLNFVLADDTFCKTRLPIDPKSDRIFTDLKDGTILCKFINAVKPGSIKESMVKLTNNKINIFEMNVNLDICLKAAKSIGCYVINIGPLDFQQERKHLILSVLWQLVKIDLLNKVSRLASRVKAEILDLGEKETVQDMVPDEILVRWVNHQLNAAGSKRRATNFSSDIKDCEIYITLFNQLVPRTVSMDLLQEADLTKRATRFLETVEKIDCRKFITADDIVSGNGRLNIAFVAYVFNKFNQVAEEPPVVASQVIRHAEDKLQAAETEINTIESEIREYQQKTHLKQEEYEVVKQRILEIEKEDRLLEEQFEERVELYKQELEVQRVEYESTVEKLEQELKLLQEQQQVEEALPEEAKELSKQVEELRQEEKERVAELESIKEAASTVSQELAQVQADRDVAAKELETVKDELKKETDQIQTKIDATGYTETKKKLDDAREQVRQIDTNIKELKASEKELKVTLKDAKEDRQRIQSAKKKIQEQLDTAKDNTVKVIKTRIETDRIIDKTTRQVRDLRGEVDRIRNNRVYVEQQTKVIKVETAEAEEQLEEIRVEKKRLEAKKQEIQAELMDKEVELGEVLVEKQIKIEEVTKEHKEELDKMKRVFEGDKKELVEEKQKVQSQLVQVQTELLRAEQTTETLKREAEHMEDRNRMYSADVRAQVIEKQVLEEEAQKLEREKTRTSKYLDEERKANAELEIKTSEMHEQKSKLREGLQKASEENFRISKEARDLESKIEYMADDLDANLTLAQRMELVIKNEASELDIKQAELKDEKRRLKKLEKERKEQEEAAINKINETHQRELARLKVTNDAKSREMQNITTQLEDIAIKEKRLEEKLMRTKMEIASKEQRAEAVASDNKKSELKMKQIESDISRAMEMLDKGRKSKDDLDRDFEVTSARLKKLKEKSNSKLRETAEQEKNALAEKLAKAKSILNTTDTELRKLRTDEEKTVKTETEKLRQQLQKEVDKSKDRSKAKKEKQQQEEEHDIQDKLTRQRERRKKKELLKDPSASNANDSSPENGDKHTSQTKVTTTIEDGATTTIITTE